MPTIVEADAATAGAFGSVVGPDATHVPNLEQLKHVLNEAQRNEYAVILGPSVDLEAAVALADTLRVTHPATSVILIRPRVDTKVLADALRSGMREVVEERDLPGLGQAVLRASQVWQALHGSKPDVAPAGKMVTVFSPKGGVGKTTIAVNLALAMCEGDNDVCLVDLDLAFGDVAITLQLFPARTLADAVPMEAGLDAESLDSLLTPHGAGFQTLVAPVQPDAKDTISASLVAKILRLLKQKFDYVIVDTAPSFDEHVLQAIDETDELLLVATLDVPTLKNVKIAAETLDLLNFPRAQRRLLLNRADEKVGLTVEKVEQTLGMHVAAAIPTSSQVASSTNSGEPIVAAAPRHPVSRAIGSLALSVRESRPEARAQDQGPKRVAPRRGLLRRGSR